jgi:SAM-dependent methyltransferase
MKCRICNKGVREILDLGKSPPANSLLNYPEAQERFPLVLQLCQACHNVQLEHCIPDEDLYKHYFYVTPDSEMLSQHYKVLTEYFLKSGFIDKNSFVFEIGSNIGQFLKFIRPEVNEILGMDPAKNICKMANNISIETVCDFFNTNSALKIKNKKGSPDLIVARHCFAHNSNPHNLMKGVKTLLSKNGCAVIENAYIRPTIENNEFDQVYHEHMFYFSIRSMKKLLELNEMKLVDVFMSPVHGESVVFIIRHKDHHQKESGRIKEYVNSEAKALNFETYKSFKDNVFKIREQLKDKLDEIAEKGGSIHTYGATAKGNTLLNFIEVEKYKIPFCVDSTKIKQGKYLPGSKIKIISEDEAASIRPDYYLLTAWNFKNEIIKKIRLNGNKHTKFIIPFPFVHVI